MSKVEFYHTFDAKLATNIGEESVSSARQAVIELARNAWDGDAENLYINFNFNHEAVNAELTAREATKITVKDDGIAMTEEDLRDKFFRIGTTSKSNNPKTKRLGRPVIGEKGMGHYAAKRLGSVLKIISNPSPFDGREPSQSMDKTISATLDWREFKHGLDFGKIRTEGEVTERQTTDTGLMLELSELKDGTIWTEDELEQLKRELGMLLIPEVLRQPGSKADNFHIYLNGKEITSEDTTNLNSALLRLTATATYDKELDTTHIKYHMDKRVKAPKKEGGYIWDRQEIKREGEDAAHEKSHDLSGNRFGDARLVFYHFPQGGNFSDEQRQIMKRKAIQNFTKRYSGIKIFMDESRLFPFGERGHPTLYDWAGIDTRTLSKQMAGRIRLDTVVGFVFVTREGTRGVKEVATRQGVMETPEFISLRDDFVTEMFEMLNEFKGRKPKTSKKVMHEAKVQQGLDQTKKLASEFIKDPEERSRIIGHLDMVKTEIKDAEKVNEVKTEDLMNTLEMYRPLSTLGITTLAFDHEIGPKLTAVSTYIQNLEEEENLSAEAREDIKNAKSQMDDIQYWRNFLDIFTTALSSLETTRKKRSKFNLRDLLYNLKESLKPLLIINIDGRKVEIPVNITIVGSCAEIHANPVSFLLIFTNLLINSIKSLRFAEREKPEIKVEIWSENQHLYIQFHDNGNGVMESNRARIWRAFVSTYPKTGTRSELRGMGLGLTLTKETIEEQYMGDIVLDSTQSDEEKPGEGFATFLIDIPLKELAEKKAKPTTESEDKMEDQGKEYTREITQEDIDEAKRQTREYDKGKEEASA